VAGPPAERPPWQAVVGTIVFVALVPLNVVVVIPRLVTGWRFDPPLLGVPATRWVGAALLVVGFPVFWSFIVRMVQEGHGTPAPVAPTRRLVVGGAFRWVRNPGYIGVVSMAVGQALLFGNRPLVAYAACLALGFHLFVVLYEEPTLRRQFGADYEAYCRRVSRWLPRRPRAV
jgi:protein-S-isoprenylcysteine O-methyltransferase Ste14